MWAVLTLIVILGAPILATASHADAGTPPPCTGDAAAACGFAEALQEHFKTIAPVQGDDGVVVNAYATGARFTTVEVLSYSSAELAKGLHKAGNDPQFLANVLETNSRYKACESDISSKIIRYGGQVERIYKTTDGHVIASVLVTTC